MEVNFEDLQQKVRRTLGDLIAFNTTNPPGNELECAQYVAKRLGQEDIEAIVLERAPGRGSVIGRIRGDGSERPFLLMSHLDVVPADAEHWRSCPFNAVERDGYVYGRGTCDMKGLTAIQLELMLALKRSRVPLRRDVILAATADEEAGGTLGMEWLVNEHFPLVDAEYALNEGGGLGQRVGPRWMFECQTAEKGVCWIRITARGESGHASIPRQNSSIAKLAAAVSTLATTKLPRHRVASMENFVNAISELLTPSAGAYLRGVLDEAVDESSALALLPSTEMAGKVAACLRNTASPTILKAGSKVNVIPPVAEAEVDCRILPGQTLEALLDEIGAVIGHEVGVEVLKYWAGSENDSKTRLFETISQVLRENEPDCVLVPSMCPAATDGRFLTARGVKVYGFFPVRLRSGEPSPFSLMHGNEERISMEDLSFGSEVLWNVIVRMCIRA